MVKIKRVINGNEVEFILTNEEIEEVRRQDNIQWAKDILVNYEDMIDGYNDIIGDETKLVEFAELLEEKNLSDNGDREIDAIRELFSLKDDEDESFDASYCR